MSPAKSGQPRPTPRLETQRLLLRPVQLTDAPAIQREFGCWEVIRHLAAIVPWPYPPDGAERFLCERLLPDIEAGRAQAWVVVEKQGSGDAIGLLEFRFPPATDNRGFWLAERFRGRGYMTEAVIALQDYVFFDLGIERFHVLNATSNRASRRIKQKTGARLVGTVELEHHSGETETQCWEVTRERWTALRRPR